jgi:hypothetical protein
MFAPEELFVRAVDYLRLAAEQPTPNNLLEAAAKLRQLFADANPLVHQANRSHCLKLTFFVVPVDQPRGSAARALTLDQFLSSPIAYVEGRWFSVIDHIRYLANYAGAIHKSQPDSPESTTLECLGKSVQIGGAPSTLYAIKSVCNIAIAGCQPLYEAITAKQDNASEGEEVSTPERNPRQIDTLVSNKRSGGSRSKMATKAWTVLKWSIGTGVSVLSLLAVVDQLWGRPWPTDPEIHPQNSVGESFVLPFTIRNKSLFAMKDVAMTCGVDLVAFGDSKGQWGGADSIAFYTGIVSIPGNSMINYPCDASGLIQVRPDGTFALRDTLSTGKNTSFQPPLKILKMCIWIGGDYKFCPKSESFTSILFKWPASQNNKQWIEGPTAVDQDRPKHMPTNNFDNLECRDAVSGPYVYIKGFGQPRLLLDVLKRPQN